MTIALTTDATTAANLDLYYARMESSLGDKVRILEHIRGKDVLDVGCGSGVLSAALREQGYNVFGIDTSPESVARARAAGIDARLGYADQAADIFGERSFDTVICSSVMHEVFSYGDSNQVPGTIASISHTLSGLHRALRSGGRFIIRDGVSPLTAREKMIEAAGMRLLNRERVMMVVDEKAAVDKFMEHSPFARSSFGPEDHDALDRMIDIRYECTLPDGRAVFSGSAASLMEFAFTYTWGPESFVREVQEYYGLFTLDAYAGYCVSRGFDLVSADSYIQEGYREHLDGKVEFIGMDFPATNALWVMDKRD